MDLNEFRPLKVKAGDVQIAYEHRIRVQGSKNMTLLSDFFLVEIFNMTEQDASALIENKTISVFGEDGGLLCSGEIDDVYTKAQGVNLITVLSVVDGKSFWATGVAKTFGGGSSIKTVLQSIIQNAKMGEFTASDVRMIRGQTYTGRLAELVSMLARSVYGRAYITNGTVYVTAKGKSAETVNLDDDDIILDEDNATGVRIIKTIVKGYPVGALVEVGNKKYRLVSQKFNADNFEGVWDSYLILVNEAEITDGGMEGG